MTPALSNALASLLDDAVTFLPRLASGLAVFFFTLYASAWTARLVQATLQRRGTDPELSLLLTRVTRISVFMLGAVIALQQVDFDLTGFVAGLGIVGFTIGFALQDVAKNFVAGLLLLLQQPFDIGDAIEVSGQAGVVEHINLRATQIRTFEGLEVLIPNTDVYVKVVRKFGRERYRRAKITVKVGSTELDAVEAALRRGLSAVPAVVPDKPSPRVLITSLDTKGCALTVWYWVDLKRGSAIETSDAVLRTMRDALADAEIPLGSLAAAAPHPDASGGVGG